MNYKVFTRTWWKENIDWTNGLEPHAGRKTTLGIYNTDIEAHKRCQDYNDNNNPGRLSRKAEFERM